jgi:hypothetical protein
MEIVIGLIVGFLFIVLALVATLLFAAFVVERELDQFDEEN